MQLDQGTCDIKWEAKDLSALEPPLHSPPFPLENSIFFLRFPLQLLTPLSGQSLLVTSNFKLFLGWKEAPHL
jgi:hypothetical protein